MTTDYVVDDGVLTDAIQCILFVNEQYALAKRLGVKDLKCVVHPDFNGYKIVFKKLYDSKRHISEEVIDIAIAEAIRDVEAEEYVEL